MNPPVIVHAIFGAPWDPLAGGGQSSVHHLSVAMTSLGFEVHTIYSSMEPSNAPQNLPYHVHTLRRLVIGFYPLDFIGQSLVLWRLLRKYREAIVIAHGENAFFFDWVCRRFGVEFSLLFHATRLPKQPIPISSYFSRDVDHVMLRRVARRAARVFTFSQWSKRLIQSQEPATSEPVVVPPGLASPWLQTSAISCSDRAGPYRLVTWGRLEPIKGLHFAIAAMALLDEQFRYCTLDIIGVGSQERPLRLLAHRCGLSHRVRFLGRLTEGEVCKIARMAHLAVFPTLGESFGLAIAEAVALGLPVVASDIGAVPEVLSEYPLGKLVPPADAYSIAAAIATLLRAPEGLARPARAAGKALHDKYSWNTCAWAMLKHLAPEWTKDENPCR